jgi:hypothetical protein
MTRLATEVPLQLESARLNLHSLAASRRNH